MEQSFYSKELLEKTVKAWQTKSPIPLTTKDSEGIIRNLTGFFDLLNVLDEKYNGKKEKKV
jgi:hypothetical protein